MFIPDKKFYWNSFYKRTTSIAEPSDFAKFVLKKIKKNPGFLLDVGCGNGRDTFFFLKNKINAVGCDQSESVIKKIKKLKKSFLQLNFCEKKVFLKKNINFFMRDFFYMLLMQEKKKFFFEILKKIQILLVKFF